MAIIQLPLWADKTCYQCKITKPITEFYRCSANKDGLQSYCRNCARIHVVAYQREHADAHRAASRRHRQARPSVSRIYHDHNRAKINRYHLQWQKRHGWKYAQYARIRLHRKRGNGGSYTQEEWRALCEQFGNRCVCCGEKTKLTVDHIIPVSKGGTSNIANLQPLCRPCNSRKGDSTHDYRSTKT